MRKENLILNIIGNVCLMTSITMTAYLKNDYFKIMCLVLIGITILSNFLKKELDNEMIMFLGKDNNDKDELIDKLYFRIEELENERVSNRKVRTIIK